MPGPERIQVLMGGVGVIEPTSAYTNAEILHSSDEAQKPIEDRHVVCIDERRANGERQPVREKVAGGNLTTGLMGAAAVDWDGFTEVAIEAGPEAMAEEVADFLVEHDEPLGAHRHAPILHDNETGCSAVEKSPYIVSHIADQGLSEVFVEQAKIDLGEYYDEDDWGMAHSGYSGMAKSPKWQKWKTYRIQEVVEERSGVVEVLDGEEDAFKDDPSNLRRNHWAESLRVNGKQGMSNDRDAARIPGFQVDKAPIVRMAEKMAHGDPKKTSELVHAMLMYQYGTAYLLTKNMRIIH